MSTFEEITEASRELGVYQVKVKIDVLAYSQTEADLLVWTFLEQAGLPHSNPPEASDG